MFVFVVNQSNQPIQDYVKQSKITVWTSMDEVPKFNKANSALSALERVDGIIIEIAHPVQEMHYILAQAIILQKPTLCLYPKNNTPREVLSHLGKKNIPKTIQAKSYTKKI